MTIPSCSTDESLIIKQSDKLKKIEASNFGRGTSNIFMAKEKYQKSFKPISLILGL